MREFNLKLSLTDSFLFIFILFFYYYGLGTYGLLNNNEGLYAEIPREMLSTGQYIIPHLNGLPYIEKPPLLYWLISFSYKVFGISETTARLIPATAGFGLTLIVYFFARKVTNTSIARLAVLILSTMGGMIVFSRMVFFDVLLTFFLSAALLSFFRWYQTCRRINLTLFYFFLALATLTKGFVALGLVTLVIFIFWVTLKDKKFSFKKALDPWGISIFLLVCAPWHIAAIIQEKEFFWFYFINEHLLRFLGLRIPKDYYHGPWYYYLPRLFLTVLPWSFMAPIFFKRTPLYRHLLCFLWSWVFVFFIFFSLSQAKANYYLVTIFPSLAMLCAIKIDVYREEKKIKQMREIFALCFLILLPCITLFCFYFSPLLPVSLRLLALKIPVNFCWIWLGGSIFCIFFLISFRQLHFWPECMVAFQMLPLLILTLFMAKQFEPIFSGRKIMAEIKESQKLMVLYRDFEKISSVRFYVSKNLPIVDSLSNDLYFGLHRPEGSYLNLSPRQLEQILASQDAFIIVFHEQKKDFESTYPRVKRFKQEGLVYIYSNMIIK
jgi:hypothetical protein